MSNDICKNYYGFIYITTNIINNRKYIGQKTFTGNWETYLGSGKILKQAVDKYGVHSFTRRIVYLAKTGEELNFAEKLFIKSRNAIKSSTYYNIHEGGKGGNTLAGFTKDERERFKERVSGENNPFYGRKHSDETKKRWRANRTGERAARSTRTEIIFKNGKVKEFGTLNDALEYLGISKTAYYNWTRSETITRHSRHYDVYHSILRIDRNGKPEVLTGEAIVDTSK